jgi:hypothetical protein
MPSPDQMLTALSILGDPDWESLVDPVKELKYDSKSQTAIVMGIKLGHFFVWVNSKKKKKSLKALDDIVAMSKALEIETPEKELKRVREQLEEKKWLAMREDFLKMNVSLQNDLIKRQKKPDLAMLISLGAYIEGANMGAKAIADDYGKGRAMILQQADLLREAKRSTKGTLDQDDKFVKLVYKAFDKMIELMETKEGKAVSKKNAEKIHKQAKKTRDEIIKG